MTDTPKTDAAVFHIRVEEDPPVKIPVVDADFACGLERENNRQRNQIDNLLKPMRDRLAKQRDELRNTLQEIADEAVKHHEHNPISGVDRLPIGYKNILKLADRALNMDLDHHITHPMANHEAELIRAARFEITDDLVNKCAKAISDFDTITPRPLTAEDQARAVLDFLANTSKMGRGYRLKNQNDEYAIQLTTTGQRR